MESMTIRLKCNSCGQELTGNYTIQHHRSDPTMVFEVEPCTNCKDAARDEGYSKGKAEGYDEGHGVGVEDGKREVANG